MADAPAYEREYTPEERKIADEVIALEKAALDRWFVGDTSGYRDLWSKKNFTYFDSVKDYRIDDYPTMAKALDELDGKLKADEDGYRFERPRVQVMGEGCALLTFQLYAHTNLLPDMEYNCVELYVREDGRWQVIHSTWMFICPLEMAARAAAKSGGQ